MVLVLRMKFLKIDLGQRKNQGRVFQLWTNVRVPKPSPGSGQKFFGGGQS